MLKGKKILLGITGSIAAYKSASIVRLLVKNGAEVKVVMTPISKEFIKPLTLATLSKNPILVDFFDPENGSWNSHVDLGLWADAFLIAPATANTMGKMANGIADNLLLTCYLSAKCPVFIAPAMDLDMFLHPANQKNIEVLKSFGNFFIEPKTGELASGLIGKGRMEEPEAIVQFLVEFFEKKKTLKNKKVLITAGPTQEKIDAVRFISNYSSGKMGYALAEECANRGAEVTLISGPVHIQAKHKNINKISVVSADEMFEATMQNLKRVDIIILAAAVSDYKAQNISSNKIKREQNNIEIKLEANKDIAAEIGKLKTKNQISIGFALENQNEVENAQKKLKKKNFDFIVLNSMNDKGAGFNFDTNKIMIINNNNEVLKFNLKTKDLVAKDIIDNLEKILNSKS
ncbi:MAG TPA: bifunctional phosphopantothenoylcysteine decarboxylase/phosphopantothenate--cysteine ligase CoaBC [Bacteroidales bacterium]|nr:bifunctional phosphopantothenoylcysteine decarboxylase/phosphopantothenate--cysteine ligase CoaBC [Bacteroidales bacterium]